MNGFIEQKNAALWVVDVQEKLFPLCDRHYEVLEKMVIAIEGAKLFDLPFFATEQYPEGLGPTLSPIKNHLPKNLNIVSKTAFSGYSEPSCRAAVDQIKANQWILIGIEAHICILQTAKDLLLAGKEVIILNDAITSRSMFDFSTAIGEMRDLGIRISNTETILYELLRDAKNAEFKQLLNLIKHGASV